MMEVHDPSGVVVLLPLLFFILFTGFGLAVLGFWVWMLVDCLKYESSQGNDKLTWVLVIILTNWVGALIYFFVRRAERRRTRPLP